MHRNLDNENVMSNRKNDMLRDKSLPEIYELIHDAKNIQEVCGIVNYTLGEEKYDGYQDSRFFKVILLFQFHLWTLTNLLR